jgi:hypothetical protein
MMVLTCVRKATTTEGKSILYLTLLLSIYYIAINSRNNVKEQGFQLVVNNISTRYQQ